MPHHKFVKAVNKTLKANAPDRSAAQKKRDLVAYLMSVNGDYNCSDNRSELLSSSSTARNDPDLMAGLQPQSWVDSKLRFIKSLVEEEPEYFCYMLTTT